MKNELAPTKKKFGDFLTDYPQKLFEDDPWDYYIQMSHY